MKIIGVIPARFNSSRFPGKPLADICGQPMVSRVYHQVIQAKKLSGALVATDDLRILNVCEELSIPCVMTESGHGTSTERMYEVSRKTPADGYVCINGDEPLIDPEVIDAVIPIEIEKNRPVVINATTSIKDPVEALDPTNIKVTIDPNGYALYFSRSPIPYPKASLNYKFYKHLGVLFYNSLALEAFALGSRGENERIEDINELRFLEAGIKIRMVRIQPFESLSVDTPKDLERVIEKIKTRLEPSS